MQTVTRERWKWLATKCVKESLVKSMGEFWRLMDQGAIKKQINNKWVDIRLL